MALKLRRPEDLLAFLDEDSGSRKQELASLILRVEEEKRRAHLMNALLRATYLLVYAHFEGFTKRAGGAYLDHIEVAGYSLSNLSPNLAAASIKGRLLTFGETKSATLLTSIVEEFLSLRASNEPFAWRGEIDTHSNLSSDVLKEILCLLGIPTTPYETKFVFIDKILLTKRNSIAHGGRDSIDLADLHQAKDGVLSMMDQLKIDICNSAATYRYRAASAS